MVTRRSSRSCPLSSAAPTRPHRPALALLLALAAAGASMLAGVSFDARPDPDNAEDLRDVLRWLRENGRAQGIDPDRIALWSCSANVRNAYAYLLADSGPWLRAAVLYYGFAEPAATRADLPVELVRAGRDIPQNNQGIDRLAEAAAAAHAPWTVRNLPEAHHAFDVLDDTEASREQIRRTLEFLRTHLTAGSPDAAPLPRGSAPPPGSPGTPPPEARAAMALFFGREYPEAATAYAAWVKTHPDDVDAWVLFGNACVEARDVEGARAALTRAKELDPTLGEVYAILGRLEAQQRNYDAAQPLLRRAIELTPDDAEARHQLGGILLAQQRYPDAVAMLEEAVRLAPGNGYAWNKLAMASMATGNHARAIEGFQRVLAYVPNDPTVLYNFACANARAGNAADITRTFPVSGTFTPDQRKICEVVLKAQQTAVALVRPGAYSEDLDAPARKVIEDAGYGDYFIHGLGHFVGLDVCDAGAYQEPLASGMVITLEPGIYIPDKNIGVRIEDEVLMTEQGARLGSGGLPREADEIERWMASSPAPDKARY